MKRDKVSRFKPVSDNISISLRTTWAAINLLSHTYCRTSSLIFPLLTISVRPDDDLKASYFLIFPSTSNTFLLASAISVRGKMWNRIRYFLSTILLNNWKRCLHSSSNIHWRQTCLLRKVFSSVKNKTHFESEKIHKSLSKFKIWIILKAFIPCIFIVYFAPVIVCFWFAAS